MLFVVDSHVLGNNKKLPACETLYLPLATVRSTKQTQNTTTETIVAKDTCILCAGFVPNDHSSPACSEIFHDI